MRASEAIVLCSKIYLPRREFCIWARQAGFRVVLWVSNQETDTQAALLARGSIWYLVFRGTDNIQDWVKTNFNSGMVETEFGFVREGFEVAWQSVKGAITEAVSILDKLFIVGHSLGAALATRAALDLYKMGCQIEMVFPVASPRVGDSVFAFNYRRRLGTQTRLIRNNADIVPYVPFIQPSRSWPFLRTYKHVTEPEYYGVNGLHRPTYGPLRRFLDAVRGNLNGLSRFRLDFVADHMCRDYAKLKFKDD